ncbi:UNVERIFIED_CONTAM: hypothetical protein Sradi_1459600 [Sesamum radiatum]|uniref:Uncharacterized protein n=1 Tax=Sesamum radiatum TaxID=300843 RepID=A0AAW2U6X8_SESRA
MGKASSLPDGKTQADRKFEKKLKFYEWVQLPEKLLPRLKESNQLKTVINHPVFHSDPLGAIYQHLQNTQPPTDEKPKRKDSKTRKKTKKKKSKPSQQAMEIQ